MGAARLGHGVRAQEDPDVLAMVKDEGIQLDTAPTSNAQTKAVRRYQDHPIKCLVESGIKATISTDSRTVSSITLTQEMLKVCSQLGVTREAIWAMNLQALDGGFADPAIRARLRMEFLAAEAALKPGG
jgi:adenosine deaminase